MWVAAYCEFSRAYFDDVVEFDEVADIDVIQTWYGQNIARCKDIVGAFERCNDILRRLRLDELKGMCRGLWHYAAAVNAAHCRPQWCRYMITTTTTRMI